MAASGRLALVRPVGRVGPHYAGSSICVALHINLVLWRVDVLRTARGAIEDHRDWGDGRDKSEQAQAIRFGFRFLNAVHLTHSQRPLISTAIPLFDAQTVL